MPSPRFLQRVVIYVFITVKLSLYFLLGLTYILEIIWSGGYCYFFVTMFSKEEMQLDILVWVISYELVICGFKYLLYVVDIMVPENTYSIVPWLFLA